MKSRTQTPVAAPEHRNTPRESVGSGAHACGDATFPTRFSWKARLLMGAFVLHMVAHSFLAMTPYDNGWEYELAMENDVRPLGLPGEEELNWIDNGLHSQYGCGVTRWGTSLLSLPRFYLPWPSDQTRSRIHSLSDWGKWATTWTASRLYFTGSLIGIRQDWPMFSPNVERFKRFPRYRLEYEDQTYHIVRSPNDPDDLRRFTHWFQEKDMKLAERVQGFPDARAGFCKMLSHAHSTNEQGSPLTAIFIYFIEYELPPPGVDSEIWYAQQNGPPADQIEDPTFVYDVSRDEVLHWDDEWNRWVPD